MSLFLVCRHISVFKHSVIDQAWCTLHAMDRCQFTLLSSNLLSFHAPSHMHVCVFVYAPVPIRSCPLHPGPSSSFASASITLRSTSARCLYQCWAAPTRWSAPCSPLPTTARTSSCAGCSGPWWPGEWQEGSRRTLPSSRVSTKCCQVSHRVEGGQHCNLLPFPLRHGLHCNFRSSFSVLALCYRSLHSSTCL